MKSIEYSSWIDKGRKLFGDNMTFWKFKCPNCANIQCMDDFAKLGIDSPEKYVSFSCIGRFIEGSEGELGNGKKPCNYTNGGLFNHAKLKIIEPNGKEHFVFEFADK